MQTSLNIHVLMKTNEGFLLSNSRPSLCTVWT